MIKKLLSLFKSKNKPYIPPCDLWEMHKPNINKTTTLTLRIKKK